MSRYFSKPAKARVADDVWNDPFLPDIRVSDHDAVDTGLLDADGNTIWRAPNPVGFGRDGEW